MAAPRKHFTEEDRREALRACWRAYNAKHRAERAAHNREYIRRPDVKERVRARGRMRTLVRNRAKHEAIWGTVSGAEEPKVEPGTLDCYIERVQ